MSPEMNKGDSVTTATKPLQGKARTDGAAYTRG